jgi:anthranilate phosphoribosyltransferase
VTNEANEALDSIGGWSGVLARLLEGKTLTAYESSAVMADVLSGAVSPAQLGGFLLLLRARGETTDELSGLAKAMLDVATPMPVEADLRSRLVDTCGTGGDRSGTINVSTMAAFVAAAAGVPVCKHGNRAASSRAGSADVLEALGVAIDLDAAGVMSCIDAVNIGFCLASSFHPAFRFVGPIRKELGVPTVFNFLGPLTNPSRLQRQILGVSDPRYAPLMLGVLQARGAERAMVVHGHDGLDEITLTTLTTVHELRDGVTRSYQIDPSSYGLKFSNPAELKGGDVILNAERVKQVLAGERGPQFDCVALNAAAALIVGGVADDFQVAVDMAREILVSGRAYETLERFVQVSNSVAKA